MGLSSDPAELGSGRAYDVVVIGSGYGAGVLAARLSATRRSICMLERGREFAPADFPTRGPSVRKEAQIWTGAHRRGSPLGLFDIRVNPDLTVLVGCGLGGTSLINANVSIRPSDRVFDDPAWPRALRPAVLTRFYQRAAEMLRPAPTPQLFGKAKLLAEAAAATGHSSAFAPTQVNVNFERRPGQAACQLCGNCVTGCRFGAKNTLCETYLPIAQQNGVKIFTQCAARWIERRGDGYAVHYDRIAADGKATPQVVAARTVVVGAGALGSTEILLRSAAHGLPLSPRLGHRFSGNGDSMALGYDYPAQVDSVGFGPRVPNRPKVGPTISGIIDLRSDDPRTKIEDSLIIEEGAFPGALAFLLRYLLQVVASVSGEPAKLSWWNQLRAWGREGLDLLGLDPLHGLLNHTQLYFAIGHDGSEGKLVLEGDRVRVEWPEIGKLPVYARAERLMRTLIESQHGMYVPNPLWRAGKVSHMITAHPLGGCVLADDPDHGVVNALGQAFDGNGGVHRGLYVVDGAIVPTSVGVNPLWTITALAEWIAEHAAESA